MNTRSVLMASVAAISLAHVPLHQQMIDRCPQLSATKPSDVQFSLSCAIWVSGVPEKHRPDVLAAFKLGIENQKDKDSEGATIIAGNLNTAMNSLKKVIYPSKTADTTTHADNGADHQPQTHHSIGPDDHGHPPAVRDRNEDQHAV